jgi:two-component system osmolarity sensor histidine kinase EnvZ
MSPDRAGSPSPPATAEARFAPSPASDSPAQSRRAEPRLRLWPRSLLWRTFLLLAALVVATTVGWFEIFRAYEIEPRARQISQNLVSIVNLTRMALVNSQPELRRELLSDLVEREGIQVYTAEPGENIVASERPLLRLVDELIRRQLGDETRFAVERDGKTGLWVSFFIDDDEYWVRVPRERIERQIALRWLGWGALALALSLLAAYVLVSRLNRPLRELAQAAGAIGKGKTPEPISESGPEEIRTLSHAFNEMWKDLARLDADRALILAGVSHDLRTPLSRLRLGLEMSGAEAQLRDGMTADIEEMDRIVNQFLDFARTDGGETPQRADLAAIAADVAEHFHRHGRSVATDLANVPEMPLQRMAMRRVVLNLVDNALRYGEKEIGIAVRAEGRALVLEVADRGPGIPASEVERLKRPFTRLEPARSDRGGAGLGLAIVERVVRSHRGTLQLLPRPGGGLIVEIRLPMA